MMSSRQGKGPSLELRPSGPRLTAPRESAAARIGSALRRNPLLLLVLGAPMLIAALYLFLFAADVYESETRFVVRSTSATSGIGAAASLMPAGVFTRANDDTHSVNAYILSRDAISHLVDHAQLLEKLAAPQADFLQRFPRFFERATREQLHRRLPDFVSVSFDESSGISTLTVRAFRPADARDLAAALMQQSERLINRLNDRAREDAIRFAADVVTKSEQRVAQTQAQIAAFRSSEAVFDPIKQSATALELIASLVVEVTQMKAALAEASQSAPNSPQVATLNARIKAYEQQIAEQRRMVTGSESSLAPKLARYEQLLLQRELATKSLASALLSLENARQDSQRQQLYLEQVVAPSQPDQPRYPRRLWSLFSLFIVLGSLYVTLRWLAAVVMEHHP